MEDKEKILKIITFGSVRGKFSSFFKKIDDINQNHGPFNYIFCTGRFFGDQNPEWENVVSGQLKCSVPLFILGPQCQEDFIYYKNTDAATFEGLVAPNIYCLGLNGVYITPSGLQIAYISNSNLKNGSWGISKENVQRIEEYLRKSTAFRGVDFLITPSWPKNILNNLPSSQIPESFLQNNSEYGNDLIEKLSSILRPRYHFCVSDLDDSFYYQRLPFKTFPLFSNSLQHLSFFISLAAFENPVKQKDLFAIKISPIISMEYHVLCTSQFEATENPFQNATSLNYLSLAKGGLVPFHILLCPISHVPCLSALDERSEKEMKEIKEGVKKMFKNDNKSIVIFDRNYHSQHLQLQIVPIPKQNPAFLADVFTRHGKKYGMDFTEIHSNQRLSDVLIPGTPYFYIELEGGIRLVHTIRGKIPLQFGREVLASPEVLSLHPDRIDWKRCELRRNEEVNQAQELGGKIVQYI